MISFACNQFTNRINIHNSYIMCTCVRALDRMNKDRSKLLKDVYGLDRYGVIQPTEWPPAHMSRTLGEKHYEEMHVAIDEVSSSSSVDDDALLSKVTSRSNVSFERMKVEKSREKISAGIVAVDKKDSGSNSD